MHKKKQRPFSLLVWWRNLVMCLGLWGLTASAFAASGEKAYVVQRGDTLSGIALRNGVSVARLTERNNVTRNDLVRIGQRLIIPPKASVQSSSTERTQPASAAAEKAYTVQRGDTLSGIAHTHGVPLSRLAERNKLSRNSQIRIGQRLVIPPKASGQSASTPAGPTLPAATQRAINAAKVKPGRWKYIVIHHSGVKTGTMAGMDRYHRETRRMENGLAYHFVIGNDHGLGDGEIGVGSRWTKQLDGGHLISQAQNQFSIGICLVGNFDNSKPTRRQMERLTALVQALMTRCNLSLNALKTHQQINVVNTRCPGRHFPLQELTSSLRGR